MQFVAIMKIITKNKRASFDYEILEKYETGIELSGQEVKSVKSGHISISGSFAIERHSEIFLINAFIPPYQAKNITKDYNPLRTRRLLMHRSEIEKLIGKTREKGLTLVPLRVYNKGGKIKIEIAIARSKKKIDKREQIREREIKREIEREFKEKRYR